MGERTCPACRAPINRGKLMCRAHWSALPAELRARVQRTWHAFKGAATTSARLEALQAYRTASDAALEAARQRRP